MISIVIISKDEASLDGTLTAVTSQVKLLGESAEVVVVDASDHRLDCVRLRHEEQVRWVRFDQPPGITVTIPHQRNVGVHEAKGEVIVFIDAACEPEPDWLTRLVAPILQGEHVSTGRVLLPRGSNGQKRIDRLIQEQTRGSDYLRQCGSANTAFRREVFDAVGGYDEGFAYGSDTRLQLAGHGRRLPDSLGARRCHPTRLGNMAPSIATPLRVWQGTRAALSEAPR